MATVRFAFERVGVGEVISVIRTDSIGSIRVPERLGETLQRTQYLYGVDTPIYAICACGPP